MSIRIKSGAFLAAASLVTTLSLAQDNKGWHLKDKGETGYYGISLNKAYDFVKSKNIKSKTVLVAVIDSGIDTLHEDLKPVLWTNPGEIPGNGIDDDKNGYVDDVHGWNFIGGRDGKNVKEDSYEATRVYHRYRTKYEGKTINEASLIPAEKEEYASWSKAREKVMGKTEDQVDPALLIRFQQGMNKSDSVIRKDMAKEEYTGHELKAYEPKTSEAKRAKAQLIGFMEGNDMLDQKNTQFLEEMNGYVDGEVRKAEARTKAPKAYRAEIVKDNEEDFNDRFYGNNDIMASTPMHGTHVSGIIAAARANGIGMDGVADNVRIMTVRAVPDGDEHDKDVALAIRYAVDNGAQIINMSFGKDFSPEKKWVDEAVKYAESKGVLLVHAAGNDAKDIDKEDNFPNAIYKGTKTKASNWITVGASGDPKMGGIAASFSNYGKDQVDVFAPGVQIYSTLPGGNTYGNLQGTSMASPVVAGTAAFILSYYPNLSAKQLKYVIEKSAVQPDVKTRMPGGDEMVNLSELSKNGGLLNAFEAIKLASTLKGERKAPKPEPKPKSTVKPKKKG